MVRGTILRENNTMMIVFLMVVATAMAMAMMIPQPSLAATPMGEPAAAAANTRTLPTTTETTSSLTSGTTVAVLERETVKIEYDELQAVFGRDGSDGDEDSIDHHFYDGDDVCAARRTLLLSLQKRIFDAFGSSSSSGGGGGTTTSIHDSESSPEETTTVLSNLQQMEPLGLLEVTNVPSHIQQLRKRVLGQHAVDLAHLPPDELSKLEFPETMYTIGWSHGKEKLKKKKVSSSSSSATSSSSGRGNHDGQDDDNMEYDTTKGSFYFDPYADYYDDHESTSTKKKIFPDVLQPQFEHDLIEMTRFMTQVGLWIAKLCDMTLIGVQQQKQQLHDEETTHTQEEETNTNRKDSLDDGSPLTIFNSLHSGRAAKARLLYYYPMTEATENDKDDVGRSNRYDENSSSIGRITSLDGDGRYDNTPAVPKNGNNDDEEEEEEEEEFDTWCGWHKDHSSLTVLLPGLMHEYDLEGGHDGNNSNMGNVHHQSMPQQNQQRQHRKHKHKSGLYIQLRDRQQKYSADKVDSSDHSPRTELVHVALQETSLGFQIGETIEIMSRGALHATPHAVKAPPPPPSSNASRKTGRASLAVFLQPLPDTPLPPLPLKDDETCTLRSGDVEGDGDGDVVDAMSSLKQRWRPTFGEFQKATTEAFN